MVLSSLSRLAERGVTWITFYLIGSGFFQIEYLMDGAFFGLNRIEELSLDRNKVSTKCSEILKWLDANQMAEAEEFTHKQKELENICNPIMTKLYQQSGGQPRQQQPGGCGRQSGAKSESGPTIEEVD